jgi:prophage antirepressor-like protein
MTPELQIFRSEDFGSVRTLYRDGEPWFVAADVCRALEIGNPRQAITRLDDDEKDAVILTDAMGRQQMTNIINEFGLYNLILGSRKPEAKAFKRWITHEVIPAIRRDGEYHALPQEENDDLPLTDTRREYLHAARSIAMASSQSLPLVRTLLQRAGIDTAPALPQKTPDTFRARLKVTIESLGLDIEDAAEIIGMSMDLMRRYMKGYVPSPPMQEHIFNALQTYADGQNEEETES